MAKVTGGIPGAQGCMVKVGTPQMLTTLHEPTSALIPSPALQPCTAYILRHEISLRQVTHVPWSPAPVPNI